MKEYTPKARLFVGGKMTGKGANIAGVILATAVLILAAGISAALVLWALK